MAGEIKGQVGDVTFTFSFENSCNCCGLRRKTPNSYTTIYVNSDGEIEAFDYKKATDVFEARKRCIVHINRVLSNLAEDHDLYFQDVINSVENEACLLLSKEDAEALTLEDMKKINSAVFKIFSSGD